MADTDCRKCKAPMPPPPQPAKGFLLGVEFKVTAYRCRECGHLNNLNRRKQTPAGVAASDGTTL